MYKLKLKKNYLKDIVPYNNDLLIPKKSFKRWC